MALLPTSQRDQTKIAIGFVAVALATYYYMYPYAARDLEIVAAREHVEKLEGQNAKARAQASRTDMAQLKDEAQRAGASLEAMRRLVPVEREVPALLEEISTAARRANLEIGGVSPEPVIVGDEFDTYRYRVTVVGGYHALTTFLANVGSLPRIVAPVSFTLTAAPPQLSAPTKGGPRHTVALLSASITLQTYVAHGPAVPSAESSTGEVVADSSGRGDPRPIARPASAPHPTVAKDRTREKPSMVAIEREVFSYAGGSRRDPFRSLLTTDELRPTLVELRLVAVAYDPAGASVAILRDVNTKAQHRVRVGAALGRMRVAAIRPKAVVFTIEELGYSRQETLGLNDPTAVRSK